MPKTLALLHTSLVFITVETLIKDLLREIMPGVRLINVVDDSLLPDVMARGHISPAVIDRMCDYAAAAEKTGADAILSLCSSLGPAIDVARTKVQVPIVKIDDAMAEQAARGGNRIGVMATVATTLDPTCNLIREKADALGRSPAIERCLVEGAFECLMHGDRDRHDQMVFDAGRRLAETVDLIAFAQASMTRLAPQMAARTGREVLTSPRPGIEHARRVLNGSAGR